MREIEHFSSDHYSLKKDFGISLIEMAKEFVANFFSFLCNRGNDKPGKCLIVPLKMIVNFYARMRIKIVLCLGGKKYNQDTPKGFLYLSAPRGTPSNVVAIRHLVKI
jgi:hypothetical protein